MVRDWFNRNTDHAVTPRMARYPPSYHREPSGWTGQRYKFRFSANEDGKCRGRTLYDFSAAQAQPPVAARQLQAIPRLQCAHAGGWDQRCCKTPPVGSDGLAGQRRYKYSPSAHLSPIPMASAAGRSTIIITSGVPHYSSSTDRPDVWQVLRAGVTALMLNGWQMPSFRRWPCLEP